jgi:hypothetical protein
MEDQADRPDEDSETQRFASENDQLNKQGAPRSRQDRTRDTHRRQFDDFAMI